MDRISCRNIVISGDIGTGKTTLTKALAKYLNWSYISAGEFIRAWYLKHQIPLEETDEIPAEIDRQLDSELLEKLKTDSHTIFEWRLGGALSQNINHIYRILCTTREKEIKRRVALRDKEHPGIAWQKLKQRSQGLRLKFKRLYQITDCFSPNFFNLVIDTSDLNEQGVLGKVLKHLKQETNVLSSSPKTA